MPEHIDDDALKRLLFDTVEGIEELEVLAWFEEKTTAGDAESVASQTGVTLDLVVGAFMRLGLRGILEQTPERPQRYRLTANAEAVERVERVVSEYRANSVRVMRLMTENAIERVRNAAVRTFAESFRIRRPKKDG